MVDEADTLTEAGQHAGKLARSSGRRAARHAADRSKGRMRHIAAARASEKSAEGGSFSEEVDAILSPILSRLAREEGTFAGSEARSLVGADADVSEDANADRDAGNSGNSSEGSPSQASDIARDAQSWESASSTGEATSSTEEREAGSGDPPIVPLGLPTGSGQGQAAGAVGLPAACQLAFAAATMPRSALERLLDLFPSLEVINCSGSHRPPAGLRVEVLEVTSSSSASGAGKGSGAARKPDKAQALAADADALMARWKKEDGDRRHRKAVHPKDDGAAVVARSVPGGAASLAVPSGGDPNMGRALVFCNSLESARASGHLLEMLGVGHSSLHGGIPPIRRRAEFRSFLAGETRFLVCTDAAARGLDLPAVSDVIVFDFPSNPSDLLHRIGRTARGGQSGRVKVYLGRKDMRLWDEVRHLMGHAGGGDGRGGDGRGGGSGGGSRPGKQKRRSPVSDMLEAGMLFEEAGSALAMGPSTDG